MSPWQLDEPEDTASRHCLRCQTIQHRTLTGTDTFDDDNSSGVKSQLKQTLTHMYARRFIIAGIRDWRDFRAWEFKKPRGTGEEKVVNGYVTAAHKDGLRLRFVWSCRMRELARSQWEVIAVDIHEPAPPGTPEDRILRPR
jgi:hypothetical protein